jgi:hypothetical protein
MIGGIEHLQYKLARRQAHTDLEWQRRAATLGGILTNLLTASLVFIAILMLLGELSIDVVPILTGAGIAGLAIGFGAQKQTSASSSPTLSSRSASPVRRGQMTNRAPSTEPIVSAARLKPGGIGSAAVACTVVRASLRNMSWFDSSRRREY